MYITLDLLLHVCSLALLLDCIADYKDCCEGCMCILQISIEAMKSDQDEISLQGIEFWSTVCDEEVDLGIELQEVGFASVELLLLEIWGQQFVFVFFMIVYLGKVI